jgi:hypothetical protein
MYISYSGYDTLQSCRKSYYLGYISKPPLLKPENRVNMLYGDTVGKIFESFYRDEIWRSNTTARLQALVRPTVQRIVAKETQKGGVFDWSDSSLKEGTRSLEEVVSEVETTIPRGMLSIRHNGLIGVDAQAELSLDVDVGEHRIGGRADFVMTRAKTKDLVLIDGKGSRHRDKYTNHRQLRWYSMLYQMKFGVIPDKLGFLYWRSEPAESLDWSATTGQELSELQGVVLKTLRGLGVALKQIEGGANPFELFPPTPGFGCKFCKFLHQCSDGQKVLSDEFKSQRTADRKRGVDEGDVGF